MAPEVLGRALAGLDPGPQDRVLVGFESADDGGAYLLDRDRALVQSVDFFTPVVDDPVQYGQIAAANALSDLYAMGARPLFALSVLGFPKTGIGEDVLHAILQGGASKLREAGVPVIGGHSVQDPEIKFGYAVTGEAVPERLFRNSGAKTGDWLLLSKPLGTGIITTAGKYQKAPAAVLEEAISWMVRLNRDIAQCLERYAVNAATDVTGYGLIGHAAEMARASGVTLQVSAPSVPLIDGLRELIELGMLPGGIETNRAYVGEDVDWGGTGVWMQQVLLDPQTSGGLLVSLDADEAKRLLEEGEQSGVFIRRIGEVVASKQSGLQISQD